MKSMHNPKHEQTQLSRYLGFLNSDLMPSRLQSTTQVKDSESDQNTFRVITVLPLIMIRRVVPGRDFVKRTRFLKDGR